MSERQQRRDGERGHLMAALVMAIALLSIFSAVAVQEWVEVIRRDNEAEMIFRAQEIVRAIQRYRQDHGGVGPMKIEDLMEPGTRGQYFMRHLYKDPLVKDGKWGLLYVGPGNTVIDPHVEQTANQPGVPGLGGNQPGGLGQNRPGLGQNPSQQGGPGQNQQTTPGGGLNNPNRGRPGRGGGAFGLQGGGTPSEVGVGGEMMGLPIAGVKSLSEDRPFRVYNGQTEYAKWLFTYFDLEVQRLPGQGNRPRPGQQQVTPGSTGRPPGRPGSTGNPPNRQP